MRYNMDRFHGIFPALNAVYDEEGNVMKASEYSADGSYRITEKTRYGTIAKLLVVETNGSYTQYDCNALGNNEKVSRYDSNGNLIDYDEYKYDSDAGLIEITTYDNEGNAISVK